MFHFIYCFIIFQAFFCNLVGNLGSSFSSGQQEVSPVGLLQPVILSPTVSEEPRLWWPFRLFSSAKFPVKNPITELISFILFFSPSCLCFDCFVPALCRKRPSSLPLPSCCTSPTRRGELSAPQTSWSATVSHSETESPGLCVVQVQVPEEWTDKLCFESHKLF